MCDMGSESISASRADPEDFLQGRPALATGYASARRHARLHLDEQDVAAWSRTTTLLYHINAGPMVLAALWAFERRAMPGACLETLREIGAAIGEICRHAGSADAVAALAAARKRLRYGVDPVEPAAFLQVIADLAKHAPHAVSTVNAVAGRLLAVLSPAGTAAWIADGLTLYPKDRTRQRAYFSLDDPRARRQLALHEGGSRFARHEERLKTLVRALWKLDLATQIVGNDGEDGSKLMRTRLAAGQLLVPSAFADLAEDEAPAFFEAAITHAAAHLRFTRERFAAGSLKPTQIALTVLLEDARVERLAAADYPGLERLWRRFHTIPASRVQTVASLFARLSRALVDPAFHDDDRWVRKGRALFEDAFAASPDRQTIARDIANVLGHDLGQLRIPFDGKSYRVEPAYRDDGLGLFDLEDSQPEAGDPLELTVEGARVKQVETGVTADAQPPDAGIERARPASAGSNDEARILGLYPEWDHRLRTEYRDHVRVRDRPPAICDDDGWLTNDIAANAPLVRRIDALLRRTRIDRPVRLKRQLDGEEIDIEAAQEALVSRRIGEMPDPRIHMIKRRRGRDLSLMLILDASASTGDLASPGGRTILQTAALSVGLLGRALADLGDPFCVLAFASDGRNDVKVTTVKTFEETEAAMLDRLAGLEPGYSTRLGAAIRHGARQLGGRSSHRKVLIVVTDGEPSDVDVEDPDYLLEDARHAVARARSKGLDIFCVALGPQAGAAGSRIFGKRNTLAVERIDELPRHLAALYFRLTVN